MPTRSRIARLVAPTLYAAGVLWLAGMAFVAAWPDMEASVFDASTARQADEKMTGLRCPRILAADEVAAVRAEFVNPTDEADSFLVRTRVSSGFVTLVREETQQVTVPGRGRRELSWPITAADAAYGRIVMVRVLAMRSAVRPSRENACGILVVGVSGLGGEVLFAAGVLCGLALAGGSALCWWARRRPLDARGVETARRSAAPAVVALAALATGASGWWFVSHLLLIAALLVSLVLLEQAFFRRV